VKLFNTTSNYSWGLQLLLPVSLLSHPVLTPLSQQAVFSINAVKETIGTTAASAFGGTNTAIVIASIGFYLASLSTSAFETSLMESYKMY